MTFSHGFMNEVEPRQRVPTSNRGYFECDMASVQREHALATPAPRARRGGLRPDPAPSMHLSRLVERRAGDSGLV